MLKYSKNSILTCKLDIKNVHIIKCPKRLPCGYTACYDCIKQLINDGNKFICTFCRKIHRIPKDLTRNVSIEFALDNSLEILVQEFSSQLKNDGMNLKEAFKDYQKTIEDTFEFLQQDIEISVESAKIEIDSLKECLLNKASNIMDNLIKKSKKQIKKLDLMIINFKSLKNLNIKFKNFKYLNHTHNFKLFNKNVNILLPSSKLIGTLNGTTIGDVIDTNDIKTNEIKLVRLKFNPYDLCNCFNETLAITDYLSHKIYLLNKKFQLIKSISCINNDYFNSPRGICACSDRVLLCDSKNQRILVIDVNFTEIKKIIKNSNYIEEPQNICCDHDSNVYVLDSTLKTIICLNLNGDLLNKFSLFFLNNSSRLLIKNPLCMQLIDNCKLAVNSNREKIIIYNLNGDIDDVIESDYPVGGLYYANDCLFTHQSNGLLICYKKFISDGDTGDSKWTISFERLLNNFFDCNGTWSITDFNKHLVFSLWNKSILVI